MPCPHYEIVIVKRSDGRSAVRAAAYQSRSNLFSERDNKHYAYSSKQHVLHSEVMLPPRAPPEFADREKLWNSAENIETQKNAQLARRIIAALPIEVSREQYVSLVREYCQKHFVSKGMVADFAIHEPHTGSLNPHVHILLTLRGFDENGKWLPKCRKEYVLDENGERVMLPSGEWKTKRVNTNDWNEQSNAEKWRQGWADIQNKYLEANNRPERADLRSYARQGIDRIPTVHMGQAAQHLEQKGIQTDIGDLNRTIVKTNRLLQALRNAVAKLRAWIDNLQARREEIQRQLEQRRASSLPALLMQYLDFRQQERGEWSVRGQLQGTLNDAQKIRHSINYLRENEIQTVDELDDLISQVEDALLGMRNAENDNARRIAQINNLKDNYAVFRKLRPVHEAYTGKWFKSAKLKFYSEHRYELEQYYAAVRYILKNGGSKEDGKIVVPTEKLNKELEALRKDTATVHNQAESLREDLREMRQVRYYIDKVFAWQADADGHEQTRAAQAVGRTDQGPKSVLQQLEEIAAAREKASQQQSKSPNERRRHDAVL